MSKEHYHCMGALPQSLQAEYLEFTKYITGILEKNMVEPFHMNMEG